MATSRPVPAYQRQNQPSSTSSGDDMGLRLTTLADMLHSIAPQLFPSPASAAGVQPPATPSASTALADAAQPPEAAPEGGHVVGSRGLQDFDGDGAGEGVGSAGATGAVPAEDESRGAGGAAGGDPSASAAPAAGSSPQVPQEGKGDEGEGGGGTALLVARGAGAGAGLGAAPAPGEATGSPLQVPPPAGPLRLPDAWPRCRVVVGGVCPPLDAPVAWLHAAMHAPDYFLYIVVRFGEGDGGQPPPPGVG